METYSVRYTRKIPWTTWINCRKYWFRKSEFII
jgi:hypothetical protein